MARTLAEAKISGRSERKRLPASSTPYWRGIDPEVHLGYRRGKRGGVWVVRRRAGAGYRQVTLGTADDEIREGTLDFDAAVRAAREWVEAERRKEFAASSGSVLTVRSAVAAYVAARDSRATDQVGKLTRSDVGRRLSRYVTGQAPNGRRKAAGAAPLAEIALHELEESELLQWRSGLPGTLKGTTKQRLINDLKAALNEAYRANRAWLPSVLPATIQQGLRAQVERRGDATEEVARDNQVLSDAQISRLLQSAREVDADGGWEGDLYRLVVVLAATGARFSQVVRMRVWDVQLDKRRLIVPSSFKGRGGRSKGTPVPIGSDVSSVLIEAVAGRASDGVLLERRKSEQRAGSIQWFEAGRGPWEYPSQLTRPWNEIRRRANLPGVIPYALRHSSIVRGLRANLPIRLVAELHDTSVAMIERHYGRYTADGLDDLAAKAVVPLIASD